VIDLYIYHFNVGFEWSNLKYSLPIHLSHSYFIIIIRMYRVMQLIMYVRACARVCAFCLWRKMRIVWTLSTSLAMLEGVSAIFPMPVATTFQTKNDVCFTWNKFKYYIWNGVQGDISIRQQTISIHSIRSLITNTPRELKRHQIQSIFFDEIWQPTSSLIPGIHGRWRSLESWTP